jgi:hypothetical protein
VEQVDPDPGQAGSVLDRDVHPGRRHTLSDLPARTGPAEQLVAGDLDPHRRDLEHLMMSHPDHRRPTQACPALSHASSSAIPPRACASPLFSYAFSITSVSYDGDGETCDWESP